jgi:hypothetical protein
MGPAFVTVLFRPFPFEVSDVTGLAASFEGLFLIGLLVLSRNRIRSIPRLLRTTPYLTYSLTYLVVFVFAFSSFANFGILSRQRVQAIPFLLVLIALPRFRDLVREPDGTDSTPAPSPMPDPTRATGTPQRRRTVASRTAGRASLPPVSSGPGTTPPRPTR